jgi:hypothetical protein
MRSCGCSDLVRRIVVDADFRLQLRARSPRAGFSQPHALALTWPIATSVPLPDGRHQRQRPSSP